jgi:hypothetical protein
MEIAFCSSDPCPPNSRAEARPSPPIIVEKSFAPVDDIRMACRRGFFDDFLLGDVSAAGITRSGVVTAQRLSTDSTEGVTEDRRGRVPCPEFLTLFPAGVGDELRFELQMELATLSPSSASGSTSPT